MNDRNLHVVVFKNGHVVDVKPMPLGDIYNNRDIIYSADIIISDGVQYDLSNRASIYSIEIPEYRVSSTDKIAQNLGVTGCLDYVLRMKAGQYWNEGKYGMSTTCLGQATKLMLFSDIGWSKNEYYRIVNELIDLGRLKKAAEWKRWIDANVPDDLTTIPPEKDILPDYDELLRETKLLETDLVEASGPLGCCEKCAKYRNRIYSLRGKDRRFPRLPADFHQNCGVNLSPYVYGVSEPTFDCKNEVKYSNRRFVDDRTEKEKAAYQNRVARMQQKQDALIFAPNPVRTSYYLIKRYFPAIAPKTMSGYMRMYNAKSKKYLELIRTVTSEGLRLPETIDDLYELEETKEFESV